MKSKCHLLYKWMKKGLCDLDNLDMHQKEHIRNCADCSRYLDELISTEKNLQRNLTSDISPEVLSKLTSKIVDRVKNEGYEKSPLFYNLKYKPVLAGIGVFIILISTVVIFRNQSLKMKPSQVAFDDEIIETIYFETIPIDELDHAILSDALMATVPSDSLEYLDDSSLSLSIMDDDEVYDDDFLTLFESFNQEDWQELRRYLS